MRIAREFRPSLAGTVATLLLLPILVSLGFWQLRRADEKRDLIERFQHGTNTTQRLDGSTIRQLPLFQEVVAHGHFDTARQILLDNIPAPTPTQSTGSVGYEVLSPMTLDEGSILLVNRGWVPLGRSRAQLPQIDVDTRARSIRGRLADLQQAGVHLSQSSANPTWPRVLNFPTLSDLRKLYGDRLLSRVVLLDPSEPDGYVREWSSRLTFGGFGPERHIAYAVQWFGLAAALVVIYVVVNFRKSESTP